MASALPGVKRKGRLRRLGEQAIVRWWFWYGLGRRYDYKEEMSDEHDPYRQLPPGQHPPGYVMYKTERNENKTNNVLLTCLLGIMGFMGLQIWLMNGEMREMKATMNLVLIRVGLTTPPPQ